MGANIFVFLFCSLLTWLLYHFRLKRASKPEEVRSLRLPFGIFGLFFLVNGVFAYRAFSHLTRLANVPPITSLTQLEEVENRSEIVLVGKVSEENERVVGNYVAYKECYEDANSCYFRYPLFTGLLVALTDGSMPISNDDFAARHWTREVFPSYVIYYLKAGEPLTVVGILERGMVITGPDQGEATQSIRAGIVFAGSHETFVSETGRNTLLPKVLLGANLVAIIVIGTLLISIWTARGQ